MSLPIVNSYHRNTLYLLASLSMIFMTFVIAVQPLYLRKILGIPLENAGIINASIQTATEVIDLLCIGYLGYLSDRFGRIPLIMFGFLLAGIAAIMASFSLEIGLFIGLGGLTTYFMARILMSVGTTAVWPQLSALTGDFSNTHSRAQLMANTAFMMAFGGTLVYTLLMQIPQHVGLKSAMLLTAFVAFSGAWIARNYLVDVSVKLEKKALPWQQLKQLLLKEQKLRLCFVSAFAGRNDMVLIGLFLMLWFIYFADLLQIPYEVAATRAGILIGLIGLVTLITIPLWGHLVEKLGRVTVIALSMGLSASGFIGFAFIINPFNWAILIPALLVGLGQAGMLLAPQILTLDIAPPDIRGSVLGAFNTIGTLGIIFFVQLGGFLFDWVGPYAPFAATGVADILIIIYALNVMRTQRATSKPMENPI